MSSYGRRAGIKIVGPLDQNKEKEIIGGLRNALERGENLEKAKQTFLNAGYSSQEVYSAARNLPATIAPIATTVPPFHIAMVAPPKRPVGYSNSKPLPIPVAPVAASKNKSKLLMIIIIIISSLILVGAGLLGLFWGALFGS